MMELAADGEVRFHRPDGRPFPYAPALPAVAGEAVPTLVSRLSSRGVAVDGGKTLPSWEGGPVEYRWAIDWLLSINRRHPESAAG